MFYVTLQQHLCGKHDIWHNFQDKNNFQKEEKITSSLSLN